MGCSDLHALNLEGCRNITDAGVLRLADRCPKLHSLVLKGCYEITDLSIISLAERY
jgi:hypothetical protein